MSLNKRALAALSLATLLAGTSYVFAQPMGPGGPGGPGDGPRGPMFQQLLDKYDTNKDGKLDDKERAAIRADHFKKLDKDGDGKISRAEFPAAMEAAREQEKQEHMLAMFDQMDTNKDGVVTQAEFDAFKPPRGEHPMMERMRDRKGDK